MNPPKVVFFVFFFLFVCFLILFLKDLFYIKPTKQVNCCSMSLLAHHHATCQARLRSVTSVSMTDFGVSPGFACDLT